MNSNQLVIYSACLDPVILPLQRSEYTANAKQFQKGYKLASTTKNDTLRRPISKRKRVWVPAASRGFELAVNDLTLPVKVRRGALLKIKNPTKTFLARLVLDPDTPGLLRLAASERLEAIQEAQTGLFEAELRAQAVLDGIRSRRAAAEPEESVLGGLDEV